MNKKVVIAIMASVSLMVFFSCCREYHGELVSVEDEKTGKWGYADTLGKIISDSERVTERFGIVKPVD